MKEELVRLLSHVDYWGRNHCVADDIAEPTAEGPSPKPSQKLFLCETSKRGDVTRP